MPNPKQSIISLLKKRQIPQKKSPTVYPIVSPIVSPILTHEHSETNFDSVITTRKPTVLNTPEPLIYMTSMDGKILKYASVWQRAKNKIIMNLRIKKMINDIKLFGPNQGVFTEYTMESSQLDKYFQLKASYMIKGILDKDNIELPFLIFHPNLCFRSMWNIVVGFLLLYTAICTPFVLAFMNAETFDVWFWLDFTQDILFIFDIILSLNTAYYDKNGTLITERKKIFLNYACGWLVVDVFSSMPFEMIEELMAVSINMGNYNTLARLLRLRYVPRLFRLSRILKLARTSKGSGFLDQVQIFLNVNHGFVRMLSAVSAILISLHISGCLFFLTAKLDNFNPNTWVVRLGYIDMSTFSCYLASIYWALTTLTTVGYGDINAYTTYEKLVAICWMITGIYFLSFTISSLSSMFAQSDTKRNIIDQKMAIAEEYIKEAVLPKEIKGKMQKSIRVAAEKTSFSLEDREDMLDDFPKQLRYEIAEDMHHGALRKFPFFADKDAQFIASVFPYMQASFIPKHELIFGIGELSHNIMFLARGKVHYVFGEENTVFRILPEGQYFGDYEVIKGTTRKYNILAASNVHLLIMTQRICEKIQIEFPNIWKEMEQIAEERNERVKFSLAEMRVLVKTNRSGTIKKISTSDFKELIKKELQEINYEKDDKEELYKQSEQMQNKELASMKEQLIANNKKIAELESYLVKLLESREQEALTRRATRKSENLPDIKPTKSPSCVEKTPE